MKIKILANEIVDGAIDFISLVRHSANRSPFKILKSAESAPDPWVNRIPGLAELERTLADSSLKASREPQSMIFKDDVTNTHHESASTSNAYKALRLEQGQRRKRLDRLNTQLFKVYDQPTHPLFDRLVDDLSMAIEREELELAAISDDEEQMHHTSAFYQRGGTSSYSQAPLSDSAFERNGAELSKAEAAIQLSSPLTQTTTEDEDAVDLGSICL